MNNYSNILFELIINKTLSTNSMSMLQDILFRVVTLANENSIRETEVLSLAVFDLARSSSILTENGIQADAKNYLSRDATSHPTYEEEVAQVYIDSLRATTDSREPIAQQANHLGWNVKNGFERLLLIAGLDQEVLLNKVVEAGPLVEMNLAMYAFSQAFDGKRLFAAYSFGERVFLKRHRDIGLILNAPTRSNLTLLRVVTTASMLVAMARLHFKHLIEECKKSNETDEFINWKLKHLQTCLDETNVLIDGLHKCCNQQDADGVPKKKVKYSDILEYMQNWAMRALCKADKTTVGLHVLQAIFQSECFVAGDAISDFQSKWNELPCKNGYEGSRTAPVCAWASVGMLSSIYLEGNGKALDFYTGILVVLSGSVANLLSADVTGPLILSYEAQMETKQILLKFETIRKEYQFKVTDKSVTLNDDTAKCSQTDIIKNLITSPWVDKRRSNNKQELVETRLGACFTYLSIASRMRHTLAEEIEPSLEGMNGKQDDMSSVVAHPTRSDASLRVMHILHLSTLPTVMAASGPPGQLYANQKDGGGGPNERNVLNPFRSISGGAFFSTMFYQEGQSAYRTVVTKWLFGECTGNPLQEKKVAEKKVLKRKKTGGEGVVPTGKKKKEYQASFAVNTFLTAAKQEFETTYAKNKALVSIGGGPSLQKTALFNLRLLFMVQNATTKEMMNNYLIWEHLQLTYGKGTSPEK